MIKATLIVLGVLSSIGIMAQSDTTTSTKYWKLKSVFGLNGTQTSFINWNAGGRNNISVLGLINASADYKKDKIKWKNEIGMALGGVQYLGKGTTEPLQKTDDRIDLVSDLGYKIRENYFFSLITGFKTQMLDGYALPNDSVRVSTFMAPAYLNLAIGIDYSPNDHLSLFVSPLSSKMTFVKSPDLANRGAFGVEAATYDGLGNLVTAGKSFRGEFGAYVKVKYVQNLATNIELKSKFELFSNYLNNPQNIDVNAEAIFNFKVNSWFSASLQWTYIYDDDINIRDSEGGVGPRSQFKSVLGLGILYKMKNYEEKKK